MLPILLSLFFPPKDRHIPSLALLSGLVPIHLSQHDLRAQGVMHFDGLTAAAAYGSSKNLQECIRRFKYGGQRSLATPLSRLLGDACAVFPPNEDSILCPVPLHWSRKFARGFNQAQLLASALSQEAGIAHVQLLRRIRPTGHQAWRTHDERRLAMHDAFDAHRCIPSHVTLVDDVATTMSTLDACACVLKNAGALHVDAIVIALG